MPAINSAGQQPVTLICDPVGALGFAVDSVNLDESLNKRADLSLKAQIVWCRFLQDECISNNGFPGVSTRSVEQDRFIYQGLVVSRHRNSP